MPSLSWVEIVYIPPDQSPLHVQLTYVAGMTVEKALEHSGVLASHPELVGMPVGIFSRAVSLDAFVKPGDRIEIYRPLLLDPMEIRRRRARKK